MRLVGLIRLASIAAVTCGAASTAGCAENGDATRQSRARIEIARAQAPPAPPVSSTPRATRRGRAPAPERRKTLTACDANIRVKASTTTCPFANNVFLSYWISRMSPGVFVSAATITAYSPAADAMIDVSCRGSARVVCVADDGSHIVFPDAAVAVYTEENARQYISEHDVGAVADLATDILDGAEIDDPALQAHDCDPNYEGECLDPDAVDYDCAGGSGDGPEYTGRVEVVGDDPHDLDRDRDGTGCDASQPSSDSTDRQSYDAETYDLSAPTTEDFGSGRGSVGYCADGTLSDSVGIQGACSGHGGVR